MPFSSYDQFLKYFMNLYGPQIGIFVLVIIVIIFIIYKLFLTEPRSTQSHNVNQESVMELARVIQLLNGLIVDIKSLDHSVDFRLKTIMSDLGELFFCKDVPDICKTILANQQNGPGRPDTIKSEMVRLNEIMEAVSTLVSKLNTFTELTPDLVSELSEVTSRLKDLQLDLNEKTESVRFFD